WRHTTNTAIVGEYQLIADDRLGLGASIRHDFNSRFDDDTTFRAQGSYRFDSGTRLHAAAGTGTKAPTFSELYDYYAGRYVGNAGLKPEASTGWEAGVEQSLAGGRFKFDATYFDNRLKDEITTVYDANFVGSPVNLPGNTRQQGVEVTAAARFAGGWRLDASYTYLHAPQDRQVTFDPLTFASGTFHGQAIRRAENIASTNLTWAPEDQPFSGTVTVRYNGPQRDTFFGYYPPLLVTLHSFALVNLNASYRIGKHVELFGRVENLLDHKYAEVYSFATPGRAAYGGIRVRL
ncbi:MAG: TonB-dependent receptor, partial [Janthinobacterium lividum]